MTKLKYLLEYLLEKISDVLKRSVTSHSELEENHQESRNSGPSAKIEMIVAGKATVNQTFDVVRCM